MEYKEYIFSLQKKTFEFWQPDKDNIVATNQPYFLHFAPDGWEGFSVKNSRNKNYWGVDRTVSLPFSYVEDGADIIKYIMYTLGIEESVYLTICKLQKEYNTQPKGVVSLSSLVVGDNVGTIKGDANSTVYVQVEVKGAAQDNISGKIGENFVGQFASTQIYTINLGENGETGFSVYFDKTGNSTATFTITNASGDAFASYGFWYKQIYRGEVDLSEFKHNGAKVTCTTLEDGLAKYLKASENTTFELKMKVNEAVWVKMDGINLHQKANYNITNGISNADSAYALDFPFMGADGDQYGVESLAQIGGAIPNTQGSEPNAQTYYVKNSGNYFLRNAGLTDINIVVQGTLYPTSSKNNTAPKSGSTLKIKSSYPNGSGGTMEYPIFSLTPVVGQSYTYNVNIPITVHPKEKLFLIGTTVSVNGNEYNFEFKEKSTLSISFISRRPTTYIRALPAQYIFNELINKVTEGNYKAAYSKYFADNNQIKWTSGNAIRGFDDAVLKISFSDFFQFYNCNDAVGVNEIGKTVLFDVKEKLIDRTKIIALGEVSDAGINYTKDFAFNILNIGYQPISSDVGTLNGNEEYNCGFQFSNGGLKATGILDKISKTSGSCYEIEKVRTTTLNKDTTDYKNDNKNFILFTENGQQNDIAPSYFNLDRSLNASATGLLEPATVFNLALSPARMLLRNGNYIRSAMYLADNLILKYTSSEKNNKLISGGIVEKADRPIKTLGKRFFYPLLFSFSVPAPLDLIGLLDLNPLSVFSFSFNGTTYYGILQEVSTSSDVSTTQNYTLLSTSDNDLNSLINYYG